MFNAPIAGSVQYPAHVIDQYRVSIVWSPASREQAFVVIIELINSSNYFVSQALLREAVSGTISAPDAVTLLRYMLPRE